MKTLMIFVISIDFLVILKWSDNFYFLLICFFPFYANYWVYYTNIITVNTKSEAVVVRRAFIYILVMLAVIHELYIKFQGYMSETEIKIDLETFFLSSSGVLYIAIDRILKEVLADYLIFKNNLLQKENEKCKN